MTLSFYLFPVEIRLQILRLLLIHPTAIITRSANKLAPPYPVALNLHPNILLVSKRIYFEGYPVLYQENTFQAHPQILKLSVFAIDPARTINAAHCIALIRRWHVRVRLDCDPYYKPETVKMSFDGVEELEIEVFRSSWGIGGYESLEGFVSVRGVRRAKVRGSVGKGFASRLEKVMQMPAGLPIEHFEGCEARDGEKYLDR